MNNIDDLRLDSNASNALTALEKAKTHVEETNRWKLDELSKIYYMIATLSSGILAASITFLTYFIKRSFNHFWILSDVLFLYFSWIALIIAIVASLSRALSHNTYIHYETTTRLFTNQIDLLKATKALFESGKIINATDNDYQIYIKNLDTYEKAFANDSKLRDTNISKAELYEKLCWWSFIIGLCFLGVFAAFRIGY